MNKRAFSLLETMVTLFMIGVMMLLISGLVRDIRLESVANKDYDQRLGAHQALERVTLSLRSCLRVDEPASGNSNRLRLASWDPNVNAARLPLPLPTPPGASWDPTAAGWLMERTFEVTNGVFLCTNTRGATSESIRLLGDLTAFEAVNQGDGTFRVALQWVDSRGRTRQAARISPVGAP